MDEGEVYEMIDRVMVLAVKGCCGDAAWRGRFCQYHQGYAAGVEMALTTSWRAMDAMTKEAAQIDGEAGA